MGKESHCFQKSLKRGQRGEKLFLEHHVGLLKPTDGRKGDFVTVFDGSAVELKSDNYDMRDTEYFFFEDYSDLHKGKVGGPWQSLENNVKFFVYFFPKNNTFFVFQTRLLVAALNLVRPKISKIHIRNKGWITQGFKILRVDLYPIMSEHKLKDKKHLWMYRS